jgi:hypothetical protein
MRFLFGVIMGIALTIGAALLHDNNVPPRALQRSPQQLTNAPIVDWDVLAEVVKGSAAGVGRMWDNLMGKGEPPPPRP